MSVKKAIVHVPDCQFNPHHTDLIKVQVNAGISCIIVTNHSSSKDDMPIWYAASKSAGQTNMTLS